MAPSVALAEEGHPGLNSKHYVYCLGSESHADFRYVGYSADVRQRLVDHNRGCNPSTARFTPLYIEGYVGFRDKERALAFERYLKTGSGHAFAKKRLW